MTSRSLHTHRFGPPDATPQVLAIHGVTGHGDRWHPLATALPGTGILAPDLLGHGRSSWEPPWRVEDHAESLEQMLDAELPPDRRVTVVGHSFGGLIALVLANRRPERFAGLVLLDPAQALPGPRALRIATDSITHWGYDGPADAAAAKRAEGWADVPAPILNREIAEHLIPGPDGRHIWRVCAPSTATAWSEMARSLVLPPAEIPVHVVIADRVQPPMLPPDFAEICAMLRPDTVTFHHVDTEHMVPFLVPELVGELVADLLPGRGGGTPD